MWTRLDWTGLQSSEGHFFGRVHMESTGVHWSPYGLWGGQQSTGLSPLLQVQVFTGTGAGSAGKPQSCL